MKKLYLIFCLTAFTTYSCVNVDARVFEQVLEKDFCDGWEYGWVQGWEYVKGEYSLAPYAPICPQPNAFEDTYRHGYNRGFLAGKKKAEEY